MSKKILLIESDAGFAREVSDALEAAGFHVRTTSDGKEGFETAHEWSPEAIVLSAELPGTSGYLVCQRLKKDDAVRSIPLVLTSAEATSDTFEKHRQLKVRAQEYLLKPYSPDELVEKLAALVGTPEAESDADAEGAPTEEEVVSLDDEMGLEGLAAEPDALPALDLRSLPDEPSGAAPAQEDEDLKLLDDAFDLAASAPGEGAEPPPETDEVDAAAAPLGSDEESADDVLADLEAEANRAVADLEDEADRALGELAAADDEPAEPPTPFEPRSARATIRGASADLLRAAGIAVTSSGSGPERTAASGDGEGEARERARADAAERRAEEAERRAGSAERTAAEARSRNEGAQAHARELEAQLANAVGRARKAEAEVAAAARRVEEAEASVRRAEELARRVEELESELAAARGEVSGARAEAEKRTADLRRRVQELETTSAKHEERVLKAYQKIKGDERLREKTRKALAIALQLLDEGAPAAESPAEKKIGGVFGRD